MLILTRKKDESIHIGDDIVITILDITGETIKIGIDAPRDIQIFRSELLKEIQRENQQAAASKMDLHSLKEILRTPEKNT